MDFYIGLPFQDNMVEKTRLPVGKVEQGKQSPWYIRRTQVPVISLEVGRVTIRK